MLTVTELSTYIPSFMEPEDLSPSSQKIFTGPYPEPYESSHANQLNNFEDPF